MKKIFIIMFFITFSSFSQIHNPVSKYTDLREWSDRLIKIRTPIISSEWMNVLKTDRFTYYKELRQWSDRVNKILSRSASNGKKDKINVTENVKKGLGFSYQGLGIYSLGKKGKLRTNPKYFKRNIIELEKNTLEEIKKFTKLNNYEYEILSIENSIDFYNYTHIEESYPKLLITFKVFDKDGLSILNKYDDNYISKSGR
tara:strand:+ start:150 stop:749 length:600 start_codon:yes stop_codon:yes gene_type:complete